MGSPTFDEAQLSVRSIAGPRGRRRGVVRLLSSSRGVGILNGGSTILAVLFAFIAATFCSGAAKADGWMDQAKQIDALEKQGRSSDALTIVTQMISDLKRIAPENELLAEAVDRKASLEQDLGRYAEAEKDYTEAIAIWRARGNGQSSGLATELNNLASLISVVKEGHKSEALHRESLELRRKLLGADHPEVALSYSNLAVDLFREERYGEAGEICQQALAVWAKADREHNRSDLAYNTLSLIELHERRFVAAVSLATLALAEYSARKDADAGYVASYRHTLALAREANGELDGAELEFKGALALLDRPQDTSSMARIGLLADYGRFLQRNKRTKEAKKMLREAKLEGNGMARKNQWQNTVDIKALRAKRTNER